MVQWNLLRCSQPGWMTAHFVKIWSISKIKMNCWFITPWLLLCCCKMGGSLAVSQPNKNRMSECVGTLNRIAGISIKWVDLPGTWRNPGGSAKDLAPWKSGPRSCKRASSWGWPTMNLSAAKRAQLAKVYTSDQLPLNMRGLGKMKGGSWIVRSTA